MNGTQPVATAAPARLALTADGALVLEGSAAALALAAEWVPAGRALVPGESARRAAAIHLGIAAGPAVPRQEPAVFSLGGISAWVAGDDAWLAGAHASGVLALGARRADVLLPSGADTIEELERKSVLTASAALLLGRLGRALVHAGAAVHPERGDAWLLVGDTHAGKSTTVANLARAGWRVLADDTVVLALEGDTVVVEGWPRAMHVDVGWGSDAPVGRREARRPDDVLGGALLAGRAPLGGMLFPGVRPSEPTASSPLGAADALSALLRQSPWLFADRVAAPLTLALLRRAAATRSAALTLGLDSFADPARLDAAVRTVAG